MTDNEIMDIVRRCGGKPIKVKRWNGFSTPYCEIERVSIEDLGIIADKVRKIADIAVTQKSGISIKVRG